MTSITDTAVGRWTINIATNFSSVNWALTGAAEDAGGDAMLYYEGAKAAGSVAVATKNTLGSLVDPLTIDAMGFGDQ